MIYVRDNGIPYSSHALDFIDVPDTIATYDDDLVSLLMTYSTSNYERPKILATAYEFSWRHPKAISLMAWLENFIEMRECAGDDEDMQVINDVARSLIRKLKVAKEEEDA